MASKKSMFRISCLLIQVKKVLQGAVVFLLVTCVILYEKCCEW